MRLSADSPLTPALSPLRGEGGKRGKAVRTQLVLPALSVSSVSGLSEA